MGPLRFCHTGRVCDATAILADPGAVLCSITLQQEEFMGRLEKRWEQNASIAGHTVLVAKEATTTNTTLSRCLLHSK